MEIMTSTPVKPTTIDKSLVIGFANEFFTLWSITSEPTFGQSAVTGRVYSTGTKTNFYFHQNLSKDESKAIAKAKKMGCVDLVPDPSVKGKRRSFEVTNRIEIEPEFFRFGRYQAEPIAESTDVKYLEWYFEQCRMDQRELVGRTIAKHSDQYVWKKGELVDVEVEKQQRARRRKFNKIRKAGFVEFFNENNIRVNQNEHGHSTLFIPTLDRALVIDHGQQPVGVYEYRGFEYGLPGGTRIKNKDIRVTIEFDPDFDDGFIVDDISKLLITKIEKI